MDRWGLCLFHARQAAPRSRSRARRVQVAPLEPGQLILLLVVVGG